MGEEAAVSARRADLDPAPNSPDNVDAAQADGPCQGRLSVRIAGVDRV